MLKSFALTSLVLASGCGTTPDDRPPTFEFISLAVLAPSCAQVQCHSTSSNIRGYAFDTLDASRASLKRLHGDGLMRVISTDRRRMPPDAPMADEDIALIEAWVAAGEKGL